MREAWFSPVGMARSTYVYSADFFMPLSISISIAATERPSLQLVTGNSQRDSGREESTERPDSGEAGYGEARSARPGAVTAWRTRESS
jgi:hypothetical protein